MISPRNSLGLCWFSQKAMQPWKQNVFCITRSKIKKERERGRNHRIFVNRTACSHPQQIRYSEQCLICKRYRNIKIQMLNGHLIGKSVLSIEGDSSWVSLVVCCLEKTNQTNNKAPRYLNEVAVTEVWTTYKMNLHRRVWYSRHRQVQSRDKHRPAGTVTW